MSGPFDPRIKALKEAVAGDPGRNKAANIAYDLGKDIELNRVLGVIQAWQVTFERCGERLEANAMRALYFSLRARMEVPR